MNWLRSLNLLLAFIATWAPVAHLLELPNKLALDGPTWLAIQQHLYRGWGPIIGAPTEIAALAMAAWLCFRRKGAAQQLTLAAAIAYAGMLGVFFVFNAPVNAALSGWTAAALPGDWTDYRLRWEAGHALAALLSLAALFALVRAALIERTPPPV